MRVFTLSVLCGSLLLAACSAKSPTPPGRVEISVFSDPPHLDPQLADTGTTVLLLEQVISGLLAYDPQQNIVAGDAESFAWSADGRSLDLRLKRGLKWSDAQSLLACQYRDGILRALDPSVPATMADLLFDIRGAQDFKAGRGKASGVGLRCDDELGILSFETVAPRPARLLHALAFSISAPIRADRVARFGSSWLLPQDGESHGVASGAYVVSSWRTQGDVTLLSRSSLGETLPLDRQARIKELRFVRVPEPTVALTMYERGDLDIVTELPPALLPKLRARPDFRVVPSNTTYMVGFGLKSSPWLKDKRVRRALALSARQEEVPSLLQGGELPAFSWVPPELRGPMKAAKDPFNADAARALLKEAGVPSPRPPLKLYFNPGERHKLIVERLANNWKRYLDWDIQLEAMEWKGLVSMVKAGAPELWRYAWTAVYPDPIFFLDLFRTESLNNFGAWSNAEYDSLVSKLSAVALEARDEAFWQGVARAEKILVEEDPAFVPVYHYVRTLLVRPNLEGFEMSGGGSVPFRKLSFK
jgi:oligopeptide transport system substrate-binding protein